MSDAIQSVVVKKRLKACDEPSLSGVAMVSATYMDINTLALVFRTPGHDRVRVLTDVGQRLWLDHTRHEISICKLPLSLVML